MDIQLPPDPRKRTKRMAMYAAGGVALLLVILGLARMKPGAPGVDRSALWIDTVKRGPMVREVRGSGTLVPEDIRWISATSSGTVERIVLRPGRTLQADEVILELTNPQLQQEMQDAEFKLSAAEAGLKNLRAQLENEYLQMQASAAAVEAEARKALLKAEVTIPETQAKDIQIGQSASVDTRNGIVGGKVVRVDPSVQNGTVTVDISLEGALPKGARPDLSVDGTIELERLTNVLYVGVPAVAQEQSSTNLFRVGADGVATRVQVKLGRASVNAIEVLRGLHAGDRVILSDTSAVGGYDRIRLQ